MTNENKFFAVSSSIKLFRSVCDVPFTSKMSADDADDLNHNARRCMNALWGEDKYSVGAYSGFDTLDDLYLMDFANNGFASPQGVESLTFTSPDGETTLTTNKGEHITINCQTDGDDLTYAYKQAAKCANALSARIPFATSDERGFLTANPLCCGTGLMASILLHSPALTLSPEFVMLNEALKKRGLGLKSYFVDKKRTFGCLYYIVNNLTLGVTEEETVDLVLDGAKKVIAKEEQKRSELIGTNKIFVQDSAWRALGALTCARKLSEREFLTELSSVRLGACIGEINIDIDTLDSLLLKGTKHYVKERIALCDTPDSITDDIMRARIMREEFSPILKGLL